MKCRVCGYEMPDDRTYCPMCGTRVQAAAIQESRDAIEMAWNTKDFPKPRKMEDVSMSWGTDSFMSKDASEGYVTVQKRTEPVFNWNTGAAPVRQRNREFEIPDFMQSEDQQVQQPGVSAAQRPIYTPQVHQSEDPKVQFSNQETAGEFKSCSKEPRLESWPMPPQQEVSDQPLWYTQNFTATGVMKTGPAYPLPQPAYKQESIYKPRPAYTAEPIRTQPDEQTTASVLQSAIPDASIQYVKLDPSKPAYATPAYPDYSDVALHEEKRPEKFNTFQMNNEEFQKLLDQEYKRAHAIHGGSTEYVLGQKRRSETFIPESSVKTQSISEFEKSLFGEKTDSVSDSPEAPKPPRREESVVSVSPIQNEKEDSGDKKHILSQESEKSELNLDELISDPYSPKFDIDTLEMTINNLKTEVEKDEAVYSARKARLKAMEAAREAYFASLDAADGKLDGKIDATLLNFDSDGSEGLKEEIEKNSVEKASETEKPEETAEVSIPAPSVPSVDEPELETNTDSKDTDVDDRKDEAEDKTDAAEEEKSFEDDEVDEDTKELSEDFKHLYKGFDEDEADDDEPKNQVFLKFMGILVLVIVVLELAIMALQRFAPDASITQTVVQINTAVSDAIENLITKVGDFFTGLLAK